MVIIYFIIAMVFTGLFVGIAIEKEIQESFLVCICAGLLWPVSLVAILTLGLLSND